MDVLALLAVIALVAVLNMVNALTVWLFSPYGLLAGAIAAALVPCAFTTVCPLSPIVRRLCASVGCRPE